MINKKILDAIFWIALVVGIVMVAWRVFGNSPTDIAVISPFIVMGLTKIWTNNNRIWELEIKMKNSFGDVKADMRDIKIQINNLSNKLNKK